MRGDDLDPGSREPLPEQVLYSPEEFRAGGVTRLTGGEAEHARRSLRIHTGDPVHLVNGMGARCRGRVVAIGKHDLEVVVDSVEFLPPWPRRAIHLAAGVLRSTRMDYLVEKASELGVARFIPLALDRAVARPGGEGTKGERWRRLAVESLKQSRRARLMEVAEPIALAPYLDSLDPGAGLWMADPEGEDPRTSPADPGPGPWVLVVGPEGGLSPREVDRLTARGARPIRLGGHRLRTETAATVLVTAALLLAGELGSPPAVDPGGPLL